MTVFHVQPRPRALLEDLPDDIAEQIEPLFPTSRRVTVGEQVHEDEWDVVVTCALSLERSTHLHVVGFGVQRLRRHCTIGDGPAPSFRARLQLRRETLATELVVPPGLEPPLAALVKSDLVPHLTDFAAKPVWVMVDLSPGGASIGSDRPHLDGHCEALLLAGDGSALAVRTRHAQPDGECGGVVYAIPYEVVNRAAWVSQALSDFHSVDPDRVPSRGAWWNTELWATPEQARAREEVAGVEREREAALALLDQRKQDADLAVTQADRIAAEGVARLLTDDGEGLVEAVADTLRSWGFDAEDMDAVHPAGDRREDLRLRDPENPSWECLVEIKGYQAGARVNDLARVLRWETRYAADHRGRLPAALWHVVNHFRTTDPSARPKAIPNDDDLGNLYAAGGVLLDTRDLFRAWCRVQSGDLTLEAVRGSLIAARQERWTPPPVWDPSGSSPQTP